MISLNCNGLGDFNKRINIITHIESLKADLICLVDTRLSDIKSRMLENEADLLTKVLPSGDKQRGFVRWVLHYIFSVMPS